MNIEQEIEKIETLAAWVDNSSFIHEPIFASVADQLGSDNIQELYETLKDVSNNGANSGFSGFIYSNECLAFYTDNKSDILGMLECEADGLGVDMLEMIRDFNCLKELKLSLTEISKALYQDTKHTTESSNYDCIIDAVCWFVLETCAQTTDF